MVYNVGLPPRAAVGIIMVDAEGNIVHWNPVVEQILGYASEEVLGKNAHALLVPPDLQEASREGWHRFRQTGQGAVIGHALELTAVAKDGRHHQVEVTVSAVPWSQPWGAVAIVRDVTERKQAERRQRQLMALVEKSTNYVAMGTLDLQITYLNLAARRVLGLGKDDSIVSARYLDYLPAEKHAFFRDVMVPQAVAQGHWAGKYQLRNIVTSQPIDVLMNLFCVPDPASGEPTCLAMVSQDITEQERAELRLRRLASQLQRAKQAAEAASLAKSGFLANVSHEIRTPMTAIMGFADILMENPGHEVAMEAARTIKRNGEHLLELINDILDLSRIEAGKQHIEFQPCAIRQLVSEVVATMRVRADIKGLAIFADFQPGIPDPVQTDPVCLRQILVNLIGNAVKFTTSGSIKVVIRYVPATSRNLSEPSTTGKTGAAGHLNFEVIDTGIGLSEEQIAGLFQPFSQADNSTSRRFGGSGLGLAISKRLAKMLDGDLNVESVPGKGSIFCLSIALVPAEQPPSAEPGTPLLPQAPPARLTVGGMACRILVVEDGLDNQRLLSFLLSRAGAIVTLADNGLKAVDLALAAQERDEPFHLVLMDMQMPEMDGYEATHVLRKAGFTQPIIALTAHAMKEDRQKCLDAGCDDYLSKPIDVKAFPNWLMSWLHPD